MEKYIPKPKGRIFKLITFIIIIAAVVIIAKTKVYKKVTALFSSGNSAGQIETEDRTRQIERQLKSLNVYDIKNYPAEQIKQIKLAEWIGMIQTRIRLQYPANPGELIFISDIYEIEPRWCYIVGDTLIAQKDNKHYLIFDIRRPDVAIFKFRGIEQIYQANVPTLNNVKIKALFYGMKNSDKPAVFEVNPPITLKADAQQPTMRIQLEIDPEKVKGFKFLIIEIKGKKYFVFK